jgi:hypothetical protein
MKKKIAIALALCLVIVSIMAAPVFAKAQKVDLVSVSGDPGRGFAVFIPYTGGSALELSLKGAMPNAEYNVFMEMSLLPGVPIPIGTMTTNVKGNANFHANAKDIPGGLTWDVRVGLNLVVDPTPPVMRFITPWVTVSSK